MLCDWANFHCCKWPNILNDLAIWSHWLGACDGGCYGKKTISKSFWKIKIAKDVKNILAEKSTFKSRCKNRRNKGVGALV